jgi:hypothetical protein
MLSEILKYYKKSNKKKEYGLIEEKEYLLGLPEYYPQIPKRVSSLEKVLIKK